MKYIKTTAGVKYMNSKMSEYKDLVTPTSVTHLQSGGEYVPMPTRGENIPTPGKSTGLTVPISETAKTGVQALKNAEDLISNLKSQWESFEHLEGPQGRAHASGLYAKQLVGTDKNVRTYVNSSKAFLGNLSRAIASERGVLTDQDIERISAVLPKVSASPLKSSNKEEGEKAWLTLESIIADAESRWVERATIVDKKSMEKVIGGKDKNEKIILPSGIKTTSQAVNWLMKNKNMNKEKALECIRSQE